MLQLAAKRMIDLIIGFTALVLLAVPFLVIAVAIRLDSKGPVFFRQVRVGKDGKLFAIQGLEVSHNDDWGSQLGLGLQCGQG